MSDTQPKSPAQTEFLLSSAIGHAEQPGVLPEGVVEPIQHLLRNVIYYRSELAGSWIEAAGELAEEILSIDPSNLYPVVGGAGTTTPADERAMSDDQLALLHRHATEGLSTRPGDVSLTFADMHAEIVRLRALASRTPGEPREHQDGELDRLRKQVAEVRAWCNVADETGNGRLHTSTVRMALDAAESACVAAPPLRGDEPKPRRRLTEQQGGPPNEALMTCEKPGCRRLECHVGPCNPLTEEETR